MEGNCMYCDTKIEIKMCCSGRECGCMGQPVEPPVCESELCWEKFSKEHP